MSGSAATEDDTIDVAGDTTEVDTTLEDTILLFDGGTTVVVAEETTAALATVTAVTPAADAVAVFLRPLLREAAIGAVAGAAGGGRLLTKGLLLSRSARR